MGRDTNRRAATSCLWALVLAPTAIGCRGPTQITLEVDTDFPCTETPSSASGARLVETSIAVGHLGAMVGKAPVTATTRCNGTHVGALVVVPSGAKDEEVGIEVISAVGGSLVACKASRQCIVARRSLHFIPHEDILLPIVMREACIGKPCDEGSTCVSGVCVSAECASSETCSEISLVNDGGSGPPDLAGAGTDAGVAPVDGKPLADASTDAPIVDGDVVDGTVIDAGVFDAGPAAPATLFAGSYHACILRNGKVTCWGENGDGQLGVATDGGRSAMVESLSEAAHLAVGGRHTCALHGDGGLDCWGSNQQAEILKNGPGTSVTPTRLAPIPGVTALAAGNASTCAVINGVASCWGTLYGDNDPAIAPTPVAGLADAHELWWGWYHACARTGDGGTSCWGDNRRGKLGIGSADGGTILSPTALVVPSGIHHLALGNNHSCAAANDGHVYCWGDDSSQQVTGVSSTSRIVPTAVAGLPGGATRVAVGDTHSCAVVAGVVWCWGTNTYGSTGRAFGDSTTTPKAVDVVAVTEVALGRYFSCALQVTGAVQCWGQNPVTGANDPAPMPVP